MSDEYNSSSLNQNHRSEPVNPGSTEGQNMYSYSSDYGNPYNSSGSSGYNSSSYGSQTGYGSQSGTQSDYGSASGYGNQSNYGASGYGPQKSSGNTSANNSYISYGGQSIYNTSGQSGHTPNSSSPGKSAHTKQVKPKNTDLQAKNEDSFLKRLVKTAALAAVFGLVSGGIFLGINKAAERHPSADQASVQQIEQSDDDEYAVLESDDNEKADAETDEADKSEAETDKSVTDDASEEKAEDSADTSDNQIKNAGETAEDDQLDVQQIAQSSATVTLDYDVADIVTLAQPSIVSITTTGTQTIQSYFQTYERPTSGAGSGILIGQNDEYLYVATNYHVIEGANEIKVGFNDGEVVDATVKGYDESADIAVVLVPLTDMKDSTKDAVTIASVGDSSALQVGEPAIAIGNALGYGQSVTVGYISALNRSIEGSEGTYIQTDAAINPGNSGGALINSKGEVVGINSVKYVDSTVEGMGFSIPINEAMSIINDILAGNQKAELTFGIDGVTISRDYSLIYGFPMGLYVKDIPADSLAASTDLHTGDIIVEFDGEEVYTNDDLDSVLKKKESGDTVEMVVYRADDMGYYTQVTLQITL